MTTVNKARLLRWYVGGVIVLAFCGGLLAAPDPGPATSKELSAIRRDVIFTIQASNESGSGTILAMFNEGEWDPNAQTLTWALPGQEDILDDTSGEVVATVLNADLFVRATQDCQVDANVGVAAGDSETTFVVGSALVSLEPVPGWTSQARATASFTVTHVAGDYAYLRGLGTPGTGAFRTYYNGYLAEGTRFTHLVGSVYVDGGGTLTASQADPTTGYRSIGEEVYDVSAAIAFTLTANDVAFGTTTSGMPEPEECPCDVNGDGFVDVLDLGELLGAYDTTIGDPSYNPDADFDDDGDVDLCDLGALLSRYGQSCW